MSKRLLPKGSLIAATLAAALLVACGAPEPPALTVGPVSFTENQLLGLSEASRTSLAQLAAFALSVADSSTDELGAPLVSEWTEDRLVEILAAELTLEKNDVGDDVLEARYLTDPEWELTVRHILFFSERWRAAEHRAEAAEKAARAMESLRAGADFAETAARLSEEPGAVGRQGLLTPGREGSWVPEFWTSALVLEPGQISAVTETQYGYHILRLEDRTIVPFAEGRTVMARDVADRIEDPKSVLDAWLVEAAGNDPAARRAAAAAEAQRRGLTVPDGERAELARAWEDLTYQWASTLGFEYGLSADEIAEAALAALANSSQTAGIVRNTLAEHDALLRRRLAIT
ncbi:MAG: peptidylprolyl isomerase, partial [Gemmatimonadetes bacterium]|nr:peptidylprolyl isomerase [Gemmatimonadota bacterium]